MPKSSLRERFVFNGVMLYPGFLARNRKEAFVIFIFVERVLLGYIPPSGFDYIKYHGDEPEQLLEEYNVRKQLIHKEIVSIGTLTETLIHPREVFEPAIRHVADSIILAHNHP